MLRRTGFGPTTKDLRRARLTGATRGDGAEYVLRFRPRGPRLRGDDDFGVHNQWVRWLLRGRAQFQSKLAVFWHDHFAVNGGGVGHAPSMSQYVRLIYEHAAGNFKDFVKAMNKNIAMMIFLNTNDNFKEIPNENYARELCELFTLGVFDKNGVANYTQADIVQIARAFTGWFGDRYFGEVFFVPGRHDYAAEFPERGVKALFDGTHGFPAGGVSFAGAGEGEAEIDEVVEILFAHQDSEGRNTVARRTAYRLLEFLTHGDVEWDVVDHLVGVSGFDVNWDIGSLLRAIITHDVFWETADRLPWNATTKKSVVWPVDFAITTMRRLNMKPVGRDFRIPGGTNDIISGHLEKMGQQLLQPPTVFGWDWEEAWWTSATLTARNRFARDLIASRGRGRFKPRRLVRLRLTDPGEIVDAVLGALNLEGVVSDSQRAAMLDFLTDGGTVASIDLRSSEVRNRKLHSLFLMALLLPAYHLH